MARGACKPNKSAAKRYKVTGTGKILRHKAFTSHLLSSKTRKRKRQLRHSTLVDQTNVYPIKKMLAGSGR